jgi:hypothetical protein
MKSLLKKFIKAHPYFSVFIIAITLLEMLPVGTYGLINAATSMPLRNFRLVIPAMNQMFAPFIGIPIYLSTNHYLKQESIALFTWGLLFVVLFVVVKKRYSKLFIFITGYIFAFSLFTVYILFTPFPLLRVIPDRNYCLVDPHSHTFYSHDGLVSPAQNLTWHEKQGFYAWFVTEHYNIKGSIAEQDLSMTTPYKSMIGEEVRVDNDPHFFLVLGITSPVSSRDITSVTSLSNAVHKQGGALVLALWWLDGKIDLHHYVKDGVDAFEIANAGHKQNLTSGTRAMAYRVSQQYRVPLLASSDWHGWGNYAYTWTAFRIPGFTAYSLPQLQHIIISMLRNKDNTGVIPVIYDYPHQYWGTLRFIFAPFFDFYYYFSTLPSAGYLSWLVWTFLLWASYSMYRGVHKRFFYNKPALLPYACFIGAGLMSLYYAVRMITMFTFIPVENTLLLTVIYIVLFYSFGELILVILWLYFSAVRRSA